jgi:hypothetical protein
MLVLHELAPSQWLWTSVYKTVIARSGKILKNAIYSTVMNYSGIGSEVTASTAGYDNYGCVVITDQINSPIAAWYLTLVLSSLEHWVGLRGSA